MIGLNLNDMQTEMMLDTLCAFAPVKGRQRRVR